MTTSLIFLVCLSTLIDKFESQHKLHDWSEEVIFQRKYQEKMPFKCRLSGMKPIIRIAISIQRSDHCRVLGHNLNL